MKKNCLFIIPSIILCASTHAAILQIPTSVVLGTDVNAGPTFSVSGSFNASDYINVQVSGTADFAGGDYTVNGAGVLVAPATSNLGTHPGQIYASPFNGLPYGAILIGNNSLGFFSLFPANAADGLSNPTPPTILTVNETLGSIFGPSVSIPNGTNLQLEVNDFDNSDNSGSFNVSSVPEPSTLALISIGWVFAFRRVIFQYVSAR